MSRTILVFGDQLNRDLGAMAGAQPGEDRILMIESDRMIGSRRYHRQRLHFVLTAIRRLARELRQAGFEVDHRRAPSIRAGVDAHRQDFAPETIVATEPNNPVTERVCRDLGIRLVISDQFLCHRDEFAEWAGDRRRLRLEDFYRWQRRRLGYLMDGDEPAGGAWNFDHDNREPPPGGEFPWPVPPRSRLDDLDDEVMETLSDGLPGAEPVGWWATSRRGALGRLRHFIEEALPLFGPYEDAMLADNWHLAHSLLSPYLNVGLLTPAEVCEAVEEAYRGGSIPISSAEGMIRQIIGWREFVWGIFWLWPEQAEANVLGHDRPLPPSWVGEASTDMRCLSVTLDGLEQRGWIHHIQRLMVLSNLANLHGIDPVAVRDWMRERYVDGADWVMGPNVMGMGLWADGGRMATKPYVSGGAYLNRMSDYCGGCRFDPKKRVGDHACPFTTLYWEFLDRHRELLAGNHRMARQYATLDRLSDREELLVRAAEVHELLQQGAL